MRGTERGASGGALAPLGSPLGAALPLAPGFPLWAALSLRSARRVAVAALSLRSARRFAASPLRGGAPARARLAALRRSRSARFAALGGGAPAPLGSPLRAALPLAPGRILPHKHIFKHNYKPIIINQSRRRREAPAFRTAKKYAPFGGVFPLSDIYFCFAYSAIALYFSKSSGRRMRALAGLVEGSSMHGMQPQGSQNRL